MARWPGNARAETTSFGKLDRGQLMARIRSRGNTTTEERLAYLLRQAGMHGWRRHQDLSGKPDFVWWKPRVAVFVDGCFWHGHNCGRNLTPRTNAGAWQTKIRGNRARDRRSNRTLRSKGWIVIRVWECHLAKWPEWCIRRINRQIKRTPRPLPRLNPPHPC